MNTFSSRQHCRVNSAMLQKMPPKEKNKQQYNTIPLLKKKNKEGRRKQGLRLVETSMSKDIYPRTKIRRIRGMLVVDTHRCTKFTFHDIDTESSPHAYGDSNNCVIACCCKTPQNIKSSGILHFRFILQRQYC